MARRVSALSLVLSAVCLAEAGCQGEDRANTGLQSVVYCGEVWPVDAATVYCDDRDVSLIGLQAFSSLRSIRFKHTVLTARSGAPLTTVEELTVTNMELPGWVVDDMPNLKTLVLIEATFDLRLLRGRRLQEVQLVRMAVPDVDRFVEGLVALPSLKRVDLRVVANGDAVSRMMRERRPDVDVTTFDPR